MSHKPRRPLVDRVAGAAEAALADRHVASAIDVLCGIGWLDSRAVDRWRRGQLDVLEEDVQVDLARMLEAIRLLRSWAVAKGLSASVASYVARTPQRQALRFTRGGARAIEELFRTHWLSPALSGQKREHLMEKANRPPELVVIQPLNHEWRCHRCGRNDDLLMMEPPGPACLACAGLGDLEYVPAGDPLLTRRARAKSTRYAVVVRFSRTRRRYERQGLLVEPQAIAAARGETAAR